MVLGHPKSTRIPRVYGLSTRPPDLGCHRSHTMIKLKRHSVQMSAKDDFDISNSLPYRTILYSDDKRGYCVIFHI